MEEYKYTRHKHNAIRPPCKKERKKKFLADSFAFFFCIIGIREISIGRKLKFYEYWDSECRRRRLWWFAVTRIWG